MNPKDLEIGQIYYRYKPPVRVSSMISEPLGMRFHRSVGDAFLFSDDNGDPVMTSSSADLCHYYDNLEIALIHYYKDQCKKSIDQMHYHKREAREAEKRIEVDSDHLRILMGKYPEEFV